MGVYAGVFASAAVSFIVASIIIKSDSKADEDNFEEQVAATKAAKASSKGQTLEVVSDDEVPTFDEIDNIIFACDAGMGSSAMGASLLRKKVKAQGIDISVTNSAINNLNNNPKTLVITQEELTNRARKQAPSSTHISVENFLDGDRYDEILREMYSKSDDVAVEAVKAPEALVGQPSDYSNVERVVMAYDGKVGATTMAASQLRNKVTEKGINLDVQALDLSEIKDDATTLVIADAEVSNKVNQRFTNVKVETYDKLLNESNYNSLIEFFNR